MNKNIYISARDVAKDARLNFELDKWFWMPYRKGIALRGMTMLFLLACFPSVSQAETCTPTPKCEDLGYTETSCPDGGVKCPWNTSLMYCCKKCATCEVKTCQVGDVLYGDKKCYTCPANTLPDQVPIGVMFTDNKAIGLVDLELMDGNKAKSACSSYSIGGISEWYLPSKDELLQIHGNINAVQIGLQSTIGGSKLPSAYYWSSSNGSSICGSSCYYVVNPTNGSITDYEYYYYQNPPTYVRPVLAL